MGTGMAQLRRTRCRVIRFPLSEPIPVKLIECIAKFRAEEVTQRGNSRLATLKKR
jgi:hypothetical protein